MEPSCERGRTTPSRHRQRANTLPLTHPLLQMPHRPYRRRSRSSQLQSRAFEVPWRVLETISEHVLRAPS